MLLLMALFHSFLMVVFLLLSFKSSLSVVHSRPLSDASFANMFSHFEPLDRVFHKGEVLNFNEVLLIINSFLDGAFGIISRLSRFSPTSYSRRFCFCTLHLGL